MANSQENEARDPADIDGYQVMVNGREVQVKDLTEEQAKIQLCLAIDFMERMDSFSADLRQTMDAWRRGKPIDESTN